jgi:hypothetical protein
MSLRAHLNLEGVTITRKTITIDAYGDPVTTSATVTLSRASIWSPSQGDRTISDKIAKTSTHILAIESGEYVFADPDATVQYNGATYKLVGHPDEVGNRGIITLHGMERLS